MYGCRFVLHTDEAVKARESAKHLTKENKILQTMLKEKNQQLGASREFLKSVHEKIRELKGPFQTQFDQCMDEMNLKRQVYHKGALVGNDVDKIMQTGNIKKIVQVFKPVKIQLQDGGWQMFSSSKIMNKVSTLLTKLSLCYQLYSRSVPLCRHEVCFLAIRCASFGCWFPVNFPDCSLLRKFHVLTHHVPEKARKRGTVGMEAEHCSESIHPVVNKLDRMYATTQNVCNRLALVSKSQWLQSNSTLRNFRKPVQRKACNIPVEE